MSPARSTSTRLTVCPLMSIPRICSADRSRLVGRLGDLDSAGLAAAPDLHLGLDDDLARRAPAASTRLRPEWMPLVPQEPAPRNVSAAPCPGTRTDPIQLGLLLVGDVLPHPADDRRRRGAGGEDLADPRFLEGGNVGLGDDPAAEDELSPSRPAPRAARTTFGNRVMCAPERQDSPTASTSSWMAAEAICSGVWCRPV